MLAGVYPRGCGGADLPGCSGLWRRGLSPRVRGSRQELRCNRLTVGSIPAGAGEPFAHLLFLPFLRVYPRGCGGARKSRLQYAGIGGLSPRVRGSQDEARRPRQDVGSIPAGAGEPQLAKNNSRCLGVYPRGCGGAGIAGADRDTGQGLSPRVRGSHNHPGIYFPKRGSIPAGAGEPKSAS